MKKWCVLFLALLQLGISASAEDIWKETTEKTVTKGVTLKKEVLFTDAGWQRVNLLEIDLTNENLDIVTMCSPDGIQKNATVRRMAKEKNAVAAVNGDFFNWEGTPLGFTVEDGEVISSPAHDTGLAAFLETEDGAFFAEYMDMKLMVECPMGYTAEILHINKYHSMESMVLYTSAWGGKTPGSHNGVSELVAEDGIVKEVRRDAEGVLVPENGFVLATSTYTSTYLVDNFKEGDEIKLSYSLTPNIENIKTAIGGGSVLVRDGKKAKFTNEITGRHPRTAIGVDEKEKTLYLVTVDGRQNALPGFTQTELAEYMLEIGAYSALNLDGGGSTTMVAREGESGELQVVNLPSDGAERAVSTAIGVRFTGEAGTLSEIEVKANGVAMEGEGVHLYLGAYDENHNPVYIADKKITYASGDGEFIGNIFYPSHAGTCIVSVACEGIEGKGEIKVYPKAEPLSSKKPKNGESILLLPAKPTAKNCLDMLTKARLEEMAEGAETVYTYGTYKSDAVMPVSRFSVTERENSLFVTVNARGGIRARDAAQWKHILEICDEKSAKNIFFLLSDPLKSFSDSAEAELFERILLETLRPENINVFVVSTGEKTELTEKNGIRYVSVAKTAEVHRGSLLEDSLKNCGLLFTVEGDKVHLEEVPVWKK